MSGDIDDHNERDLRRRRLATQLIDFEARSRTIMELTGLTRYQLRTLLRRAAGKAKSRSRGPGPTSLEVFFATARSRSEGTVLAFLCHTLVHTPEPTGNGSHEATVEYGERLCEVFDLWQQTVPNSRLEFEHMRLIAEGLESGVEIAFDYCGECHALILIDLLAAQRRICGQCTRALREAHHGHARPPTDHEDDVIEHTLYGIQLSGAGVLRNRATAMAR